MAAYLFVCSYCYSVGNQSQLDYLFLKDCKDYHQAKDGDGWVEQSSQPFLFGMLQKVVIAKQFR